MHATPARPTPAVRLVLAAAAWVALAAAAAAQPMNESTVEDLLRVAGEELAGERPYSALELYAEAYGREPNSDLAYTIAELNFELRDYKRAANYFSRALRRLADGEKPEALYYLGVAQKMQGLYGEARESLKEFQRMAPGHDLQPRAQLELDGIALALSMSEPPRISVENAGRLVNSTNQEYSPVLASDGSLYYAGFGKNGLVAEEGEDAANIRVYVAPGAEDGGYGKGVALPKAINRPGYQTANVAVSPDGRAMAFLRTQIDGRTVRTAELFFATRDGDAGEWGEAEPLASLNGDHLVKHPAFGELYGERVLFYASDQEGGLGGYDLYYATEVGPGEYAAGVNLGEAINTPYDDVTPYYAEGTLYFSTDGRPSLGGFDVYRARSTGDAWTTPENMGKGFNSSLDDRYFQLDPTGKRGVLASNRPPTRSVKSKTCCDDIFLLNVEPIVTQLLAQTLDAEGQLLPQVTLDLYEVADGDSTGLASKLNPKGNRFDFELVDGKNYVLIGHREGYADAVAEFNTLGVTEPGEISKTLVLERNAEPVDTLETIELTLNQPIRLANIYYDFDDAAILADAEPDLQYIIDLMEDYPEMVVELGSHTDAQGADDYNLALSQRRAQSAVDWIAARGIAAERLVAKGYGEEGILNQCVNGVACGDEEHRFNRRTEFKILEGPQAIQVKKLERRRVKTTETEPAPDRGGEPAAPPADTTGDGATGEAATGEAAGAAGAYNSVVADDLSSLYYERTVEDVPVLVFDERRVDFGAVRKGDTREHRYTFVNEGTAPASIAIATACECTTLDYTRGEIPPGGEGFVNAVFDSSDKDAGELIVIDVILEQEAASGNPVIERVQYAFDLEE